MLRFSRTPPGRIVSLSASGRPRGQALVSYLREPVGRPDRSRSFRGHSNQWESREVARSLVELGFAVDVIDFDDSTFVPQRAYDVVLALDGELCRLAAAGGADVALLHMTGADPAFQNAAEQRRLAELAERRGVMLSPRRQVPGVEAFEEALSSAHAISLIGNAWTRSTFAPEVQRRMTCIPVSTSIDVRPKSRRRLVPQEREFLWFFGSGAVHKGLDRVLEAFARTPELTLNVVGNIAAETDFVEQYHHELHELANIRFHGFLEPSGSAFRSVARRCFGVVAPSCSEGTSPAIATMLQLGLLPIVSRETGISLDPGAGTYLETCSVDEIREAAGVAHALAEPVLRAQIEATQRRALAEHTRERFGSAIRAYLKAVLGPSR